MAGTVLGYALLAPRLGPEGWKVAAALCGSYIGGSVNFAAVAQALALTPGPALAGAMAADNIAMAAYIALIMSVPPLQRKEREAAATAAAAAAGAEASGVAGGAAADVAAAAPAGPPAPSRSPATAESLALSLAAAALACTLGERLAAAAGFASGSLAAMALLASGAAMAGAALARQCQRGGGSSSSSSSSGGSSGAPFAGGEALGGALMMLFFATIGAGAGSLRALRGTGWLLAFIAIQLGTHLAVTLGLGAALRLPTQALLIASNANVGGPATAAAMASAKRWPVRGRAVLACQRAGGRGCACSSGCRYCCCCQPCRRPLSHPATRPAAHGAARDAAGVVGLCDGHRDIAGRGEAAARVGARLTRDAAPACASNA